MAVVLSSYGVAVEFCRIHMFFHFLTSAEEYQSFVIVAYPFYIFLLNVHLPCSYKVTLKAMGLIFSLTKHQKSSSLTSIYINDQKDYYTWEQGKKLVYP